MSTLPETQANVGQGGHATALAHLLAVNRFDLIFHGVRVQTKHEEHFVMFVIFS